MIDFESIKTTPCGKRCEYGGAVNSLRGKTTHRYAVWAPGTGWVQWVFDDQGRRLMEVNGDWVLYPNAQPIAPPPKRKVWAYYRHDADSECRSIWLSDQGPEHHDSFDYCEQDVEVP